MYTLVYLKKNYERTKLSSHDAYSMNQHSPQVGRKQQQHDDIANLVSHFIHEDVSVKMRKRLEMEAISY